MVLMNDEEVKLHIEGYEAVEDVQTLLQSNQGMRSCQERRINRKPDMFAFPLNPEWKIFSEFLLNGEALPDEDDDGVAVEPLGVRLPLFSGSQTGHRMSHTDELGLVHDALKRYQNAGPIKLPLISSVAGPICSRAFSRDIVSKHATSKILEETKEADGESDIHERMQLLCSQLVEFVSDLHEYDDASRTVRKLWRERNGMYDRPRKLKERMTIQLDMEECSKWVRSKLQSRGTKPFEFVRTVPCHNSTKTAANDSFSGVTRTRCGFAIILDVIKIVQYPLEYPEKFEKFGMTPSRESLFYDLPGAESWSSYGWRKDYDCGLEAWLATLISDVKEIIPVICAFYDMYLDADADTLAWLFAMDENQIPLFMLREIQKALLGGNAQDSHLVSKFIFFCKFHSSLILSNEKIDYNQVNHLLDYMYHSIVNNEASNTRKVNFTDNESDGSDPSQKDVNLKLLKAVIKFASMILGAQPFLKIIEIINQKFLESAKKKETVEEIKVPSVSELHEISRVKFRLSPRNKSIRNISFINEKERFSNLPLITLNACLEVILRNLVAHENLMAKNSFTPGFGLELAEYVDFMCGIIDTIKDVRLLREEKIIEGNLGDAKIVKLFNGTRRCHRKMSVESELWKTVDQLNKVYESLLRVWVQSLVEN
ncbi:putative UPF0481 protein [Tanacetum coccineum]